MIRFLHWFILTYLTSSCWVLCGWSFLRFRETVIWEELRRHKSSSLGMPRMASPLSSSSIGNFTWSYIFIYHMICFLLGASIYFVRISFLLFRTMFCIFYFKKVALIAFSMPILEVHMLLFENIKFTSVAIIP